MKQLVKLGLVSTGTLLLVACQHNPQDIANSVHEQADASEEALETIQVAESKLSGTFSEAFKEDDISTDQLSENRSTRQKAIDDLDNIKDDFSTDIDKMNDALSNGDLSEEDEKDFKSLLEPSETVVKQLNSYLDSYHNVLSEEETYYNQLTESDMDFEGYQNGLDKVNEQHEDAQNHLKELESALSKLHELDNREEDNNE
ncbi:YkyA family protein [Aerococcus suis]|uniref:Cell-wall binding lipoprotein n=1 Tax=Aerococcus suis TaxID=371602 RepID=A0A1W1Y413_9LACT|nr:YkyA family protein [Aerococcus suis]MCI7240098.1 YkyA family protein [Aerococcus suis]MDD7758075.1 YkyA family protein [Aerococcus suis]MDY4646338.1 YkyA family protein [Aerococcus suis]SMC30896.1 hypothetical protein SAMN04487984_0311 [Aerococcus suis]